MALTSRRSRVPDQLFADLLRSVSGSLSRPWTTAELAATLNLSESHTRRLFVERTGVPPMQYIRNLRLEAAHHLLTTSTQSVKEIAARIGWGDMSHFVRAFRARYGRPPSYHRLVGSDSSLVDNC